MGKMKVNKFIEQLNKALDSHTVYGSGAFGASIGNFPDQLKRYYDNTLERCGQAFANKVKTEGSKPPCWAFDCNGLVKAIIWGWDVVANSVYGGADYKSNGLDDLGTGELIDACYDVSTDFSKISVGELLWIRGHVGVYVGNGMAIECTIDWDDKVQKVEVWNIKKTGKGRVWTKHGKLPWIEYNEKPEIICPCCGAKFILSN